MEHGEYVPLELLLATNRLGYEDYRAWREGRLETLDAVLADGQRESCAWLEAAQSWACALGLAAEPTVHHGWEENAGTVLVASSDLRLNALLSTRFRHIREHDQLDLFIDSAQTAAVNTLVHALTARNVGEARGAPRAARANQPRPRTAVPCGEVDLGAGGTGTRGTRAGSRPAREDGTRVGPRRVCPARRPSARFPGTAVARHRPRARRGPVLSRQSRTPCIQGVPRGARLGAHEAIGPRRAELRERAGSAHPARGGPFEAARPSPRHRIVVRPMPSCARGVRAVDEASDFPDWSLQHAWRVAQEQALEHEMTPAWFPVWMLLEEPGLAGVLAPRHTDDKPSRAFDLVIALLSDPDLDERGIELRRSLQKIHPGLLERFLATRARATAPVPLSG